MGFLEALYTELQANNAVALICKGAIYCSLWGMMNYGVTLPELGGPAHPSRLDIKSI